MPVRQEGARLQAVLAAVSAQDCPELDQIVVALAPGDDLTERLVLAWAAEEPRAVVIANPEGIVSPGLNRALAASYQRYVVRVDGHCLVPPDLVSHLLATVRRTGATCAGPRLRTCGEGHVQRGIAAAMSSSLGVGGARFRTSTASDWVDTVAFGLYERGVLARLGGFRPELVRNQDDELNARVRRDGGRIYLDADVCVDYFPRDSLRGLGRQYYEYGYWRTVTARTCGDALRVRQLVPGLLVAGVAGGAVLAAVGLWQPLAAGLSLYALGLLALAGQSLRRTRRVLAAAVSPAAGAVMHLAYGAGLWRSLLRPSMLRPWPEALPPLPPLTSPQPLPLHAPPAVPEALGSLEALPVPGA
ncbi:MAG: glycosyltransferase family 2 protein [Frankiales bacterium]|nr:glycosyltransferase family 2 protein [Frankiales bacterium]